MPKQAEVVLYCENGWNAEKILSVLEQKQSVKDYAFILHDSDLDDEGKPKKPHYHLYLNFGRTNVQFQHIAGWFQTRAELVEKVKTNKRFLLQYFLHCNHPEKAQYDVSQMVASFDVQKFFASKELIDSLETVLRKCADGTITPLNFQAYIDPLLYARHQAEIMHAWEYADHAKTIEQQTNRELTVIYVTGESGTGKTLLCKLYAQQLQKSVYISASGKDPFSNYSGEEVVILDDFRPEVFCDYAELLKLLDPHHASPIKSRYHNKLPKFSICFITTVLSIEDFIHAYPLSSIESELQFHRRIYEVWIVTKPEIIIQQFDPAVHQYITVCTKENPIPAWLKAHVKERSAESTQAVLARICDQYASAEEEPHDE